MKRWLVLFLGCVACGDNGHPARLLMEMGDGAPPYGRAPFPTDADRDGLHIGHIDGLDRMAKQHGDLIAAHLETLGGWGLRPTIEFFFEGSVDEDTVPALTKSLDDSLMVMDVDPATAEDGAAIPFEWRYDADRHVIAGSPQIGQQLREGTRYAAILTTDIKGRDGQPVFGAYELGKLLSKPPSRWATTAEAYEHVKAFPQLEHRIAGITVFTTQDASDTLIKARNAIASSDFVAPPTLSFSDPGLIFDTPSKLTALLGQATRDTTGPRAGLERWGLDNPTGIAHDHIAVVATGTTTIARLLRDPTHTNGPEDETFELTATGVPKRQSVDEIPITIVLPKGTMPATGFPVIVFGHGLGGSRRDMLNLAEPLAAQGYAMIAIDMWNHGSRLSPADNANNLGNKPDFTGDRTLRDGFSDDADSSAYIAFFHEFMNLSAIRDAIRQSTLDFSRVAILIQSSPSLAALAAPYTTTPKLDKTRVAYLGQSFGTIIGTDLAAIEPSIGLYVLNVAGGGIVDQIVPNSAKIGDLALPVAQQLYRTEGKLDRFHPLFGMMQATLDACDSLTYARHVLKDRFVIENSYIDRRHVVVIEAMNDEMMPNIATEALARGFGLHVLRPNLSVPAGMLQIESPAAGNVNSQTAVLVQYEPATHGYNWSAEKGEMEYKPGYPFDGDDMFPKLASAVPVKEPIYETLAQVTEALQTYFSGGTPRVRSTLTPVADFDGDGKPDTSDPDPLDPTK